jgi:hypothetical protein
MALTPLVMLSATAHAASDDDWCATVKLPSSVIICGDPALRALADERQRAFDTALARLSPDQQKQLLADQKGLVTTYPRACGVSQNEPPPNPVPDPVKDCFKRAGEARIEYLRSYGTGAPSSPPAQSMAPRPLIRITKERWWCPYAQRYYPEAQICPTGSWQLVRQDLDCRNATEADDIARCLHTAQGRGAMHGAEEAGRVATQRDAEIDHATQSCIETLTSADRDWRNMYPTVPSVGLDRFRQVCAHYARTLVITCHYDEKCVSREQLAEDFVRQDGRTVIEPQDRVVAACVINSLDKGDDPSTTKQKCGRT